MYGAKIIISATIAARSDIPTPFSGHGHSAMFLPHARIYSAPGRPYRQDPVLFRFATAQYPRFFFQVGSMDEHKAVPSIPSPSPSCLFVLPILFSEQRGGYARPNAIHSRAVSLSFHMHGNETAFFPVPASHFSLPSKYPNQIAVLSLRSSTKVYDFFRSLWNSPQVLSRVPQSNTSHSASFQSS